MNDYTPDGSLDKGLGDILSLAYGIESELYAINAGLLTHGDRACGFFKNNLGNMLFFVNDLKLKLERVLE